MLANQRIFQIGIIAATFCSLIATRVNAADVAVKSANAAQAEAQTAQTDWMIGPFTRPTNAQPVITPNPASVFDCPMRKEPVHWQATHTFNPAAIVRDGKVYVIYRAEDDHGSGIGGYTSRLGLAVSDDGIHFQRMPAPVLFPAEDDQKAHEWEGGCEDPRCVELEDGSYALFYTQYYRLPGIPRQVDLGMAVSKDLIHWTKTGPVTAIGADGTRITPRKSASLVCALRDGRLVAARINGRYWLYYGEGTINLMSSPDLKTWRPEPAVALAPRKNKFDSSLAECGPPALLTPKGIVLLYNGKNAGGDSADPALKPGVYANGQALFDANDPTKLLSRPDQPFFKPELPWEATGQYAAGTTFIEGLVAFKGKWMLYYGCADSFVGVAMCDLNGGAVPAPLPAAMTAPVAPRTAPEPKSHPLLPAQMQAGDDFGKGTPLQGVRRIIVVGDSITQGGDGPQGYVGLMRAYLSKVAPGRFRVVNAGISGNKTTDLLARFDRDVLEPKPDLITINIGVNDVWHGFDKEHPQGGGPRAVPLEQYRSNLEKLVKSAQAQGITVVLVSPTGVYEDQDGPQNAMLAGYIAAMRDVAQKNDCIFVDLRQPFQTYIDLYRTTWNSDNLLTRDGVHMNDWGNRFMAATLLTALTSPAPSGVKIHPAARASGNPPLDLALRKTVTASSTRGESVEAARAVDGDIGTRWSSDTNDDEWLTVDLGTPQRIGKVCLYWERAYAKAYKIQVSDDDRTWLDVVHVTDGQGGEVTHTFRPTTARYVRVLGEKRGTTFGYSLWDVNIYAPGTE